MATDGRGGGIGKRQRPTLPLPADVQRPTARDPHAKQLRGLRVAPCLRVKRSWRTRCQAWSRAPQAPRSIFSTRTRRPSQASNHQALACGLLAWLPPNRRDGTPIFSANGGIGCLVPSMRQMGLRARHCASARLRASVGRQTDLTPGCPRRVRVRDPKTPNACRGPSGLRHDAGPASCGRALRGRGRKQCG